MITLYVNGARQDVDAEPETPLLWVLREQLGLTGTKFGCGMSLCGVCTVHVDGKPVRSCLTAVSEVADKAVDTIEGLSKDGLHPVQAAWIAEDVPQCGYCQSGQIMTAVALLRARPRPSDQDIDAAMSTVLCRCGTYQRIRRAIHRAAESMQPAPGAAAPVAPAAATMAPAPAPGAEAMAPAPAPPEPGGQDTGSQDQASQDHGGQR